MSCNSAVLHRQPCLPSQPISWHAHDRDRGCGSSILCKFLWCIGRTWMSNVTPRLFMWSAMAIEVPATETDTRFWSDCTLCIVPNMSWLSIQELCSKQSKTAVMQPVWSSAALLLFSLLMVKYICVSSAYWWNFKLKRDITSLSGVVNRENSNGPRYKTWGTPVSLIVVLEEASLILMKHDLLSNYDLSQLSFISLMPNVCSSYWQGLSSRWCRTLLISLMLPKWLCTWTRLLRTCWWQSVRVQSQSNGRDDTPIEESSTRERCEVPISPCITFWTLCQLCWGWRLTCLSNHLKPNWCSMVFFKKYYIKPNLSLSLPSNPPTTPTDCARNQCTRAVAITDTVLRSRVCQSGGYVYNSCKH